MTELYIDIHRDGRTGQLQLSITDGDGGYRLAGPKYNGSSKTVMRARINTVDAQNIRRYLDRAFPQGGVDGEAVQ